MNFPPLLALKVPVTTVSDDIPKYVFIVSSEKIRLNVQVNPLKNQALFSSKDKSKKLKCHLQFLYGTLRASSSSWR